MAFTIHKAAKEFMEVLLMPQYFKTTRLASFNRLAADNLRLQADCSTGYQTHWIPSRTILREAARVSILVFPSTSRERGTKVVFLRSKVVAFFARQESAFVCSAQEQRKCPMAYSSSSSLSFQQ
jgi:hypothetical protein